MTGPVEKELAELEGVVDTGGVQAAEVGRIISGVLQTRLGAWSQSPCTKQWLQSGTHPGLIPIKRVLLLCAVWPFA